ncbi:hypothetical protein B7C42_07659 [Nocardia cerradoensis]|uniref:Uncharacterized protein n=1 Tax=Nocardia cerradoensis TaxID=85688 RepID=A0A231GUC8_9NOCA|nr:hypothetical protein B7C42_07659 [Nocardia cerradoensis]
MIVVAGLCYHYLLVMRGVDPVRAVEYLMMIAVPLTAIVLPASSIGAAVRMACQLLGTAFGALGGGGGPR